MKLLRFKSYFENKHYEETYWSKKINGKEVTITIKDVQNILDEKNVDVENIAVDDVSDMCVHKDKDDEKTLARSEKSNLDYPIIISKDLKGNLNMILDGHHRLLKAINNNHDNIKARILDLSKCSIEYQTMFG